MTSTLTDMPMDDATSSANLELLPRADASVLMDAYLKDAEDIAAKAADLKITRMDDAVGMALARDFRLGLRQVRLATEKRRVELVEGMTKETRRINAVAKAVKDFIEPLEARLLEQEQFADREKTRIMEQLRAKRAAEIAPYLTQPMTADLALMEEDIYAATLQDAKDLQALRIAREKGAAEAAAAQAKAEAEERERMRAENVRLKAEAAEKERLWQEKEAARLAEVRAAEKAAAAERAQAQAALQAEREAGEARLEAQRLEAAAIKAESDAVIRRQREAAAAEARRIEEENAARMRAEEKAREKEEAAIRAKAAAPDKEKLLAFAAAVAALTVPAAASPAGQAVAAEVAAKVASFARWITTQAETL